MAELQRTISILADLVAFPSVSGLANGPIADYCAAIFESAGAEIHRDVHPDGQRQNIYATIGPRQAGGVMVSGHMDVVPADPAGWSTDPFKLTERGEKLLGRGSVDMKGFLALVLATANDFGDAHRDGRLRRPLHVAFTFDEETCSFGAAQLVDYMARRNDKPAVAIVGEPTRMVPIVGHKAGIELTTLFKGRAGHASKPHEGVSAIAHAARFVAHLEDIAAELARNPAMDSLFNPPYTTLNIGRMVGGEARNVIADSCRLDWEIRPLPGFDGLGLLADIKRHIAQNIIPAMRAQHPEADVIFLSDDHYPGLEMEPNSAAVELLTRTWPGLAIPEVVSFGTDGCYIQQAGISTVVFGPGNLAHAHLPDEFIEKSDLVAGLTFMAALLDDMTTGVSHA